MATRNKKSESPAAVQPAEVAANEGARRAHEKDAPKDLTQRQAIKKHIPHLFVLREKGCSWMQIAGLLETCGFTLQASTIRSYFGEMVPTQIENCRQAMDEHKLAMAMGEKKQESLACVPEKFLIAVAAMNGQQRSAPPKFAVSRESSTENQPPIADSSEEMMKPTFPSMPVQKKAET